MAIVIMVAAIDNNTNVAAALLIVLMAASSLARLQINIPHSFQLLFITSSFRPRVIYVI